MSNQQPQKNPSSLTSPQVLTAIIGGVVTLVAAILGFLPAVLNQQPEVTAVIVVTATLSPTSEILAATEVIPTAVELVATAVIPTAMPIIPTAVPPTLLPPTAAPVQPTAALPANVLLMWDDVSFTAINQDTRALSFVGVTFASASGFWDARDWGPSLYNSLPPQNCLRLRDATAGQRNPPRECANLYGLILAGASAIFWRGADSFDVLRDGQVIATCPVAVGQCGVALP